MIKKYLFLLTLVSSTLLFSPGTFAQSTLKDGPYKFKIERDDHQTIDFITSVKDSAGKKIMYIINGNDRMLVDSILVKGDSAFFELPFFESGFAAKIKDNGNLQGVWIKRDGNSARKLPFMATFNDSSRFQIPKPSAYNITGMWTTIFKNKENKESDAIGQFSQNGSHITGTFLTPYGDYRFLEGVVSDDSLFLSGFDGSYALYFTGKIIKGNQISGGKFYSGNAALQTWTAQKDNMAVLKTPENIARIKPNAGKLDFSFPDMKGNMISIKDDQFKNKVVVIQIMGSWCPNCVDETKFFMDNYDYYTSKGVTFLGISYERTADYAASVKALQPFQKRFQIPYPILIPPVALSDPLRTEKTLPQVESIVGFPTTIFLDKHGNIKKIHTGFDGPATGVHYLKYKKEFEDTINELLNGGGKE